MTKIILSIITTTIGGDTENPGARIDGTGIIPCTFSGVEWVSLARRALATMLLVTEVIKVSIYRHMRGTKYSVGVDRDLYGMQIADSDLLFCIEPGLDYPGLAEFKYTDISRRRRLVAIPLDKICGVSQNVMTAMMPVCGVKPVTKYEQSLFEGLADEIVLAELHWPGNSVSTNF